MMFQTAVRFVLVLGALALVGSAALAEEARAKAPDFRLPDVEGRTHALSSYAGKWVVLEWVNYDCPFVKKHYDASRKNMQALQRSYREKGVVWLSICSSAPGKQGHMTPEQGKRLLAAQGAVPTALLLDPEGRAGRAYGAQTTPDMRIIDPQGHLVYAGAIDDVRSADPRDIDRATNHVRQVLDAVLAGRAAPVTRTRPYGCSVKYGPEPAAEGASTAPDFELPDVHGRAYRLSDLRGKWVVLEWVNYDCPFVKKHYDASRRNMQSLQKTYAERGVIWLSICSSAPGKQGHLTPEEGRRRLASLAAMPAALLLDPAGTAGRAYGARTTPDMRIIDPQGRLVYAGAIDDVQSADVADIERATNHVRQVLDAVLDGRPAPVTQTRPYGCSVKYPD